MKPTVRGMGGLVIDYDRERHANAGEPMLNRPRGMHRKTYHRLRSQAEAAEAQASGFTSAWVA
jgi:hypothetical protein